YTGKDPIFEAYGVEVELHRALNRRVWLRSGGYLVVEETEALTSIDVNTGRYTGHRNLEETILKTNLEAVREIVYQLRLRNLGGIIVIDFIDMEREENRERVHRALQEALHSDRAKSNVLKISELGLVEMTRKRTQESLRSRLTEPCFYCEGRGYLRSRQAIASDALREVLRVGRQEPRDSVVVHAHPEVIDLLFMDLRPYIESIEQELGKHIVLIPVPSSYLEDFDIIGADTGLPPGRSRPAG
ncbi:MAG: Rne/Rng family ribonuclease, partial [Deltaproteobacteria bacterium]|nr:Rne/Rng family ribonuclease [Deltaproteobacteria bacterium]